MSIQGLTSEQVKEKKKNGLVNGSFSVKTKSIWQIFFTNVFTLFNFINLSLALCLFLVHSYKNMLFLGVVFWNILIGIIQEVRAKITIDKLSLLAAPDVIAIRDGKKVNIDMEDIVLGECLILKSGNQVCVDGCILEGECEVNESLLTGECDPVYKKKGDEVLSGSYIISGNVVTEVIHIGKDNFVNTITSEAKKTKKPNSEILRSINIIMKVIGFVIPVVATLLLLNQLDNQNLEAAIVSAVSGVLGMIPSGLVLLTSVVLAVSVVKLGKRNTLVQELYCIETLARVDVLCLDKTGTITEGTLSVDDFIPFTSGNRSGEMKNTKDDLTDMLKDFVFALDDDNPTYIAIKSNIIDNYVEEYDSEKIIRNKMGFSSEKKWSLVDFETEGCYVLGAMEFMFDEPEADLKNIVNSYAVKGQRVLVFARSKEHFENGALPEGLEAVGIILLSDTIREEAPDTFKYFVEQGVDLKVISGDNPRTVSFVAQKAGIPNGDKYVDATLLATDEDIKEAADKYTVFGRVTPNQKLKLVKALKEKGHTVAMTGDGVNDVMALRESDCSIAMQSGSEAARNVSQLVLLDSNFASMPAIVAEGRQTINNLQRSAALYLTKTIYSTILAIMFVFLPSAFPFIPIQLTFIGALSIGIPSFVLALEPNKNRVHGHFLVNVLKKALPGATFVITNLALVQVFLFFFPAGRVESSTINLYGLAIAALLQLVECCIPFNYTRVVLCGGLIGLFIFGITFFKELLGISYLNPLQWIFIIGLVAVSGTVYSAYSLMFSKRISEKGYFNDTNL